MKHIRTLCLLLTLTLTMGTLAYAQGGAPAKPSGSAPQAQTTPQPAPTVSGAIDRQISILEKEIVEAAEAMPEDKFNFSPEGLNIPGSDYKGVRSFAVQIKHIATANWLFWGSITGDKPPYEIKNSNGPDELKTKAEIIKFLKDSYAIGHKAAATLTPENVADAIPFRQQKAARIFLVTFAVSHGFDHYGQMVEYLRMNGIVPPASKGN
ncbi:MAG TPA: DinB family protein [Candidatus Angelobacter sp.]|nr:DinB family protein [Candidatus Angelobacter sp.]